jgi:tRNA (cmo5U34)-methyltransferase
MNNINSELQLSGDSIAAENASWNFGGSVPLNFETHVARSVPMYSRGHELVVSLSDFFLSRNSLCYEIGSSTGILLNNVIQHNKRKDVRGIGVDVEVEMIRFAQNKYKDDNLTFLHADINDVDLENCDMIISYYSIQFVKPKFRQDIFNKIYQSLNWGGCFVLFEKVRAPDARFQDIVTALYTEYKIDKGYEPSEIISKSRSLKGVLEPFSTAGNIGLMERAGFRDITTIMKYLCFEGFMAIK